eukprot:g2315.t1
MHRYSFFLVSLACLASLTLTLAKQRKLSWTDRDIDTNGYNSAILVAGSEGYWNYRHQSDICHAYQMLKKKGMTDDDIIIFIYDDIAWNYYNPYPGKIYNIPDGYDVYPGCNKDYTGYDVNKYVLAAVLRGDAAAVKGKGSGRVLRKDPNQRVFFAYSDHGDVGYIPFPAGPPLYADEFNKLLIELRQNSMFKEMIVYVEACYAGSMFYGMPIKDEDKILGVSAAGPYESSYATYCPYYYKEYKESINPNVIGSCMGDLFTVAWIQDAETRNVFETTIHSHLVRVTAITSVDWTYYGGSHVYEYGDKLKSIINEKLGVFFSSTGYPPKSLSNFGTSSSKTNIKGENYKQIDADLLHLFWIASQNNNSDASLKLEKELAMRKLTDEVIYSSLHSLIKSGHLPTQTSVSKYANEVIPRGEDEPVVNDWDCLRAMVAAWEDKCGRLNSYSGQYSRTFVNLCNAMVSPVTFKEAINCQQSMPAKWDPQ